MANIAGVLRGGDFSHHQEGLNLGLLPLEYFICRTAQAKGGPYGTVIDRAYGKHKANVARTGKPFSAYFYLGAGLSPKANVDLHASVEPDRGVPLMLDWETGSGNGAFLRQCYDAFTAAGYYVWGLYAPRWYWASQGSPDLSWGPPLVSSRYVDNIAGGYESEYASTPESYWTGYGNQAVRMLQFTSSGRLQPYPSNNIDLDAFKGTVADLVAWWSRNKPTPPPGGGNLTGGVEMLDRIVLDPSATTKAQRLYLPGGPACKIIVRPESEGNKDKPVWQGNVYAWASAPGQDRVGIGERFNPMNISGFDRKILFSREIFLPGAVWADYEWSSNGRVTIDIFG